MKLSAKILLLFLLGTGLLDAASSTNQALVINTNNSRIANFTNFFLANTNLSVPAHAAYFTPTFVAGSAGSDFAISSSGTTHTFNLPTASALTRGLLSGSDWTTFNSKAAASHTHAAADITSGTIDPARLGSGTSISTKYLRGDSTWQTVAGGGGDALVANPLSQFAATTSAQLRGVISDETGSGAAVFADSPSFTTPNLNVANATTIKGTTGNLDLWAPSSASVRFMDSSGVLGAFINPTTSFLGLGSAADVNFGRDAANTLAQRNGTAAQTFRLYNTYTDASNYERGVMDWSATANTLTIGTQKAGTGATRGLSFVVGGVEALNIDSVGTAGFAASVYSGGDIRLPQSSLIYWNTRSVLKSPSDGVLTVSDYAGTSFNRLQFGGTTASFPSLKRSSTALQVRLADDSGLAPLDAGAVSATTLTLSGAVSFPAGTRQTFSPNATTPGLNVGSVSADPSSLSNGDVWLQSTTGRLRTRLGGASVDIATGAQQDFELTTVSSGATIAIDLNANQYQTLALATDATTVTTSNRSATKGRAVTLFVLASGAQRTFTLNGSWRNFNGGSTSVVIPSGKEAAISLFCTGSAETDVRVSYTIQP